MENKKYEILKPIPQKIKFFSTGTFILLAFIVTGFTFGLARFILGLGSVTNLNNQYPWGIWIAIDVACGVALAAGGFTTAALVEIFGSRKYKPLLRPAILTAWLGYAMVAFALFFDLGKWWNMWRPIFNWQGNSVLFEVGMCVMGYLTVLTFEIAPSLTEGLKIKAKEGGFIQKILLPLEKPIYFLHNVIHTMLPFFILAGVVLSFMHQSSLGTLMLIAPTKINPFWYTPILPILFLLSAIMVGYPMVIFESIISSKSFNKEIEIELLSSIARKIPYIMGIYMIFKFSDLILRFELLDFLKYPSATISFIVEIIMGLLIPFFLLLIKRVRRTPGWLFFACFLIIIGVVLNRINVYLIGYHPSFVENIYFPAIGEILVTVSIICLIMLLYRFFANYFPILSGLPEKEEIELEPKRAVLQPKWAWIFRGIAVFSLLIFVFIYSYVHKESIKKSIKAYQLVYSYTVKEKKPPTIKARAHIMRPRGYRTIYYLSNDILNSKTDYYGPVRFSHRSHDNFLNGNCAVCHHRISFDESDRIGLSLEEFHRDMDINLGAPCSTCHKNMEEIVIEACDKCHRFPDEPDNPARIGLKGAYHRQCIGCHERVSTEGFTPVGCEDCHKKNVPEHKSFVVLSDNPSIKEITKNCLKCHEEKGKEVLNSVHFKWGGHSPQVSGYEHSIELGLHTILNNYMIGTGPNLPYCAACHIGFGWVKAPINLNDPKQIDCLVCHDTAGKYKKDPFGGGFPDPEVNLREVAESVGLPNRKNCGSCHFYSDGGPNIKHGDLSPNLIMPSPDYDVHMGAFQMVCQDCHWTKSHKILGRSLTAPASEGELTCQRCHSKNPHKIAGLLGPHLDNHIKSISCETCHIPIIAKEYPTRIYVDFSKAGLESFKLPKEEKDLIYKYDKKIGLEIWKKNYIPAYRWYDGKRKVYKLGDKIKTDGKIILNEIEGDRKNPNAKIYPFKIQKANQPYDKEERTLVVPKFYDGFWNHFNWEKAVKEGMEYLGMPYSGNIGFIETEMYTSIHHSVVPKKKSLGCTDCHSKEAVRCSRCHKRAQEMELPDHYRKSYPNLKFLDFEKLGYEEDPAITGGRFYTILGRGLPPQ